MGTQNNSCNIDSSLTTKATPVAADSVIILDSAANSNMKQATLSSLPLPASATTLGKMYPIIITQFSN